ncbi:hypothetical protein HJO_16315 [Hyphomonas johnsonii MHS-2]|uniref:Uncharacterized protein n=1 Tax=Hyphomonas johnsonii MHS-2 TaxID=1280950 RepID=A0A059FBI2_9PROT|nr:hypothetical protein HJO_16315 [Hyphomonas johnsonii MHS-2]
MNANWSPVFADEQVLSDEKIAPLAKSGVSFLRDTGFHYFTFMVTGAPKIVVPPSDFHEDLILAPLPFRALPHRLRSTLSDLVSEVSSEPINPGTDAFVADINATLVKQILCAAKREWKSDLHQHP